MPRMVSGSAAASEWTRSPLEWGGEPIST